MSSPSRAAASAAFKYPVERLVMVLCVDVSQADTTCADEVEVALCGDADQQAPATKVVVRKFRLRCWAGDTSADDDFKEVTINPRAEWQNENSNVLDLAKETITFLVLVLVCWIYVQTMQSWTMGCSHVTKFPRFRSFRYR